jgi:hypothetical protein
MILRTPDYQLAIPGRPAIIAAILGTALAAGAANAQQLPTLRAGLWETSRTIESPTNGETPRTLHATECTSPNDGMRERQEMLEKIGCTLSPLARSGNTYTFSAVCGDSATETTKSILTVENDSAYSIRIESTIGGTPSQELLRATRVGDCTP